MGVIFVGGVYAVGKTTACTDASTKSGVAHFTASRLIKEAKATAIPNKGKIVADIADNQRLLINGVSHALVENGGRIILDGHFTFPMSDGSITRIDVNVFRALGTIGVVMYHDDPVAISSRFRKRDGELHTADVIKDHQNAELNHARHVTDQLRVPIVLLNAFDSAGLVEAIEQWNRE